MEPGIVQVKSLLKSKELEDRLRELINNKMKPGDQLLPERVLAQKFKVGRITAKTAVDNLAKIGVLERIKRKGTFVANNAFTANFLCLDFPTESFDSCTKQIKRQKNIQLKTKYKAGGLDANSPLSILSLINAEKYDLISINEGNIPILAERNLIQPLDELLDKSSQLSRSDFFTSLLDNYFTYKGKLYGLPVCWASPVLIYNKKLFKRYDLDFPNETWTWGDLKKACKKFNMPLPGKPLIAPLCLDMFNSNFLTTVLWQRNAKIFDENNYCLADTANFRDTIAFFYSLITDYGARPYIEGELFQASAIFERDRLAMVATFSSFVPIVTGDKDKDEWGISSLPSCTNISSKLPTQGIAISSKVDNRNAFAVMEEIFQLKTLKKISALSLSLPGLRQNGNNIPQIYLKKLEAKPFEKESSKKFFQLQLLVKELTLVWNKLETPENVCKNIKLILNKTNK